MPFIQYKAFADSEKFLFDYKIKTDKILVHYEKLKQQQKAHDIVKNNLVKNLIGFSDHSLMKKVYDAIK
jgi:hypothetical protein